MRRGRWPGQCGSCPYRRTEKQSVFALGDEAGGGELEDERAVDFLVEGEVEAVEGAVGVAESGLLVAPGEEAVLTALELVGDERGDEVDGGHLLDLGLLQARVEDIGHAGEAELAEGLVEFCRGGASRAMTTTPPYRNLD